MQDYRLNGNVTRRMSQQPRTNSYLYWVEAVVPSPIGEGVSSVIEKYLQDTESLRHRQRVCINKGQRGGVFQSRG